MFFFSEEDEFLRQTAFSSVTENIMNDIVISSHGAECAIDDQKLTLAQVPTKLSS